MTTIKSTQSSLPPCAICRKNVAIYRCPRCHTCTCSLACCRTHKRGSESNGSGRVLCDGKRDRTKFCSVNRFTDSQLASDYHFLEDVLKVSDGSKRLYQGIIAGGSSTSDNAAKRARVDSSSHMGRLKLDSVSSEQPDHPLLRAKKENRVAQVLAHAVDDDVSEVGENHLPGGIMDSLLSNKPASKPKPPFKRVDPLVRQAEVKGVNLLRMPNGMERRKANTTRFNKKKGVITWKMELCFHPPNHFSGSNKDCESLSLVEKSPMLNMLKVESETPESSTLLEELGRHLDVHPGNSTTRSRLRPFSAAPRDSITLLMKRLPCSSAAPQYFKLDPNVALMESLKGKTVIEFPTIDVIIGEDKGRFPLFIDEVVN
ncbi:hypothetical protein ACHAWF_015991 [Thalassiosira exigua]